MSSLNTPRSMPQDHKHRYEGTTQLSLGLASEDTCLRVDYTSGTQKFIQDFVVVEEKVFLAPVLYNRKIVNTRPILLPCAYNRALGSVGRLAGRCSSLEQLKNAIERLPVLLARKQQQAQ